MSLRRSSFRSFGQVGLLLVFCWLMTGVTAQAQPTDLPPVQPRLVPQIGHTGQINSAEFSADGKQLITGSMDKTAQLWDVATGKTVRTFEGHTDIINSVVFSPDDKQILTASIDHTARLWNVATGKTVRTFANSDSVTSAAFSPDGKQILMASPDGKARMWNIATGKVARVFTHSHPVLSAVFSADGKRIFTVSNDNLARLWDVATNKVSRKFEVDCTGTDSAALSRDEKRLLTINGYSSSCLWDIATGKVIRTFKYPSSEDRDSILSVKLSTDGKLVLTISEDYVARLWNVATGKIVRTFQGIGLATFYVDGKQVFIDNVFRGGQLWDVSTGKVVRAFQGHTAAIEKVAYSADGKQVLTACGNKTAQVWNMATGRVVRIFTHSNNIESAAISPNSKQVIIADDYNAARLFDVATGKIIHIFNHTTRGNSTLIVKSVMFSADGKQVLTACWDKTARLWDIATGKVVRSFRGHNFIVASAVFSADGKQVLTASDDKTARLWDAATGKVVHIFNHGDFVYSAAFSPDGKRILTTSGDRIARVWDVATGTILHTFDDTALSAAFSNDGKQILTTNDDTTVRLWDAATGQEQCQMFSFDDSTWAVVDSQGRYDASNAGDIKGLVWVIGNEPVALKQFQDAYYEPFLLAKITGNNPDPIRPVPSLDDLRLYPDVQLSPLTPGTNRLKITLANRGGGIGKVQVLVNGKQLQGDARAAGFDPQAKSAVVWVDLAGAAVVPGALNHVEVKVSNAQGTLESRSITREVQAPGDLLPKTRPRLYAIVVGTGKYGDPTKLKTLAFTTKDARDMVQALRLGGQGVLFGPKNVHITWLSSDTSLAPVADILPCAATKANIEAAFKAVAKVANPEDVLVVYFSGHGLTLGQGSSVYCYPTQDARTAEFAGSPFLKDWAVTSEELAQWTDANRMAPQKQVLILDTCAAGVAAVKLNEHKELSGDQVRAVQRLQDRVGFHVLMGSAADAVSYEASRYGQGLLTYALLEGLRGPALRNENFVDVDKWFHYAEGRVPELARGIGGVQKPEIAAPKGSTFDVGELPSTVRDRLPPTRAYVLVLRPRLWETASLRGIDTLGLNTVLRSRLRDSTEATTRGVGEAGKAGLVYVDAEEMSGALEVGGRYTLQGEKVVVEFGFFRGAKDVGEPLNVEGTKADLPALADKIVQAMQTALAQLPQAITK